MTQEFKSGQSTNLSTDEGEQAESGIVENLDPTEDGEACEEPTGAADNSNHSLQLHLGVLRYLVKC